MNLRRIGVLLLKEWRFSSRSFFFIFSILGPLAFTLFLNLVFGSLFSDKPKLGIFDLGNSELASSLEKLESIRLKVYGSEMELKSAVGTGKADMGIILQERFDYSLKTEEKTILTAYIWGESLSKDRAIIAAVVVHGVRELTGKILPVEIVSVPLGNRETVSWKDRLLPLLVLMAIFISGFAIPSSSLVDEKEKRTLGAVLGTPATPYDVFISKGILGIVMSMVMGTAILILNQAFTAHSILLFLILFSGAVMSSCFGLIVGALMNDMASLYSAIKGLGIVLYAPGLVKMFPQIPQWIGRFFPTYYVINPVIAITRRDGSWLVVRQDVIVLVAIIAILIPVTGAIARKTRQKLV